MTLTDDEIIRRRFILVNYGNTKKRITVHCFIDLAFHFRLNSDVFKK